MIVKSFRTSFMILRLFFAIVIGAFVCNAYGAEKVSPKKAEDIHKLLKVSGIFEQLEYMKKDLEKVLSARIGVAYPKIPDNFWREFDQVVVSDQEMNDLIARITPVYARSMNHETIKKLIEMFDNPFWEQWKMKMPTISREAGRLGGSWIREMSESQLIDQRIEFLVEKYDLENLNHK